LTVVTSDEFDDLKDIRSQWATVIDWVARRNPFVASYLRPAELEACRGDCLVLSFGYKVHFERVTESRNRTLVEQACKGVLGRSFRIDCKYSVPAESSEPGTIDFNDPVLKF